MVGAKTKETFSGKVEKLAHRDSDSLVGFFNGLRQLSDEFDRAIQLVRADPKVELTIGVGRTATLRYRGITDYLSTEEVERFADSRDGDNPVNSFVHDLLNDVWRIANGQEIESKVEVMLL